MPPPSGARPATRHTAEAQEAVKAGLPFSDRGSFEAAARGFVASLEPLTIGRASDEKAVFDLVPALSFLKGEAPATVNPSLWRQAQLTTLYNGLFEVVEGIYQVRAFDLANMTLVRGSQGWVVIDPLTAEETARAALDLANRCLGKRRVSAVVYTHSHADHFLGALGVVSRDAVESGEVPVIAPLDFAREALSENVLVGPAMSRRASFMYGSSLEKDPQGFVTCGLGASLSQGTTGFLMPTDTITSTGEKRTVDGVEMVFQMTMGTEAPSEMTFYFPQYQALCMSEITSHHLHNVYTPRGAQVRDAEAWAAQIQEAIDLFGDTVEVQFASHHWPTWGRMRVRAYLEDQRDIYKYIHDQTVRLANHGYNKEEIAESVALPPQLAQRFHNRDYYGTVHHNARAVYVKYLGFLDGNPSHLHPLHPHTAAAKYVEFMGGSAAVVARARGSFEAGEYRWVAEVLNHVVLSDPANAEGRALLADALEQLGYQAESGSWRNFYLSGAQELRQSPEQEAARLKAMQGAPARQLHLRVAMGMPLGEFMRNLAIRLDGPRAADAALLLCLRFSDAPSWLLEVRRGVLHSYEGRAHPQPSATLRLTTADFKRLAHTAMSPQDLLSQGRLEISGDATALVEFLSLLDTFPPWFPIVTPRARL